MHISEKFVKLAMNSIDHETGTGDLLTYSSFSPFIAEKGSFKIEEFCMILGLRSDQESQRFFCLSLANLNKLQDNCYEIVVTTIDGVHIKFTPFGYIEINDSAFTVFAPLDLKNPDVGLNMHGGMMSTYPQAAPDAKWSKLAVDAVSKIRILCENTFQDLIPNPDFQDFPARNIFIEHISTLQESTIS